MANETGIPVLALKAHLAINVKYVKKSLDFYRKMLGIEPSKVRTGYAKFDVQNPPLNLILNEVPFGERGALSHLGIQVRSTEDVFAVRQRWADQDLITRDEMQTNCCYARQDKTWLNDPDGNLTRRATAEALGTCFLLGTVGVRNREVVLIWSLRIHVPL